jgi:RimJ/RimL family protein N-acetyltransferase
MPSMLETERLQMRLWRPSDAERIRCLWTERDPRSLHVIDADGRPTLNDLRAAIQTQLVATARTGLALLAIDTRINCEFIGYCGLIEGRATIDGPEIAFELFRRARGQGYATEASEAVVAAAAETGRARLWSTVRAWNVPSLRVLDKLRFVRSGKVEADVDRGNLLWLTRTLVAADVAPPVR